MYVSAFPYDPTYGAITPIDLLTYNSDQGVISTDVDFGDVFYRDPVPTWPRTIEYAVAAWMSYRPSGSFTSTTAFDVLSIATTDLPTASSPLQPILGPVVNPTINGLDFFTDHSAIGLTPTIQWSAPTLGTPSGYRVGIAIINRNSSFVTYVGYIYTTSTSVTLPPGMLTTGINYAIKVIALYRNGIDMSVSPRRTSIPNASAPAFSGVLTP